MRLLCDLDVVELVLRIRVLEHENAALLRALSSAFCGHMLNLTTTCQLARGHDGLHAWAVPDGSLVVRWGD